MLVPTPDFRSELGALLNRYSKENGSGTPGFILADFLIRCLEAWDHTSRWREEWHVKSLSILGNGDPASAPQGSDLPWPPPRTKGAAP